MHTRQHGSYLPALAVIALIDCVHSSLVAHSGSAGLAARPSCAARSGPVVAAGPEYLFELTDDKIRFGCKRRSITLVKPESAGTFSDFVATNAEEIMLSSWGAGKVQRIDGRAGEFIVEVDEFDFVVLKVGVELTIRVSRDPKSNTVRIDSRGFRLVGPGLERIGELIDIRVSGWMRPSPPQSALCSLTGHVEFEASGAKPGILQSVPPSATQAAARAVSEALINAAAERFDSKVPAAYAAWAQRGGSGAS